MRLTTLHRKVILDAAVEQLFGKRYIAHEKAIMKLADAIHNAEFGKLARIAMKLPGNWRHMNGSFHIKCDGFASGSSPNYCSNELKMSKQRAFPDHFWHPVNIKNDHACYERAQVVAVSFEQLRTERSEFTQTMNTLLYSVNTTKRLKEVWPEGEKFFPPEVVAVAGLPVPFGLTLQINQLLGLGVAVEARA